MIKRLSKVVVFVSNLQEAVEWYREKLLIEPETVTPGYAVFNLGGCRLLLSHGGERVPPKDPSRDLFPLAVITSDNINEDYQRMVTNGVKFSTPPQQTDWGSTSAIFYDLDGNRLMLAEDEGD